MRRKYTLDTARQRKPTISFDYFSNASLVPLPVTLKALALFLKFITVFQVLIDTKSSFEDLIFIFSVTQFAVESIAFGDIASGGRVNIGFGM